MPGLWDLLSGSNNQNATPNESGFLGAFRQLLSDPENRAAITQFGIDLASTPGNFGQSLVSGIAGAEEARSRYRGEKAFEEERARKARLEEEQGRLAERKATNEERRTRAYEKQVERSGKGGLSMTQLFQEQRRQRTGFQKFVMDRINDPMDPDRRSATEKLRDPTYMQQAQSDWQLLNNASQAGTQPSETTPTTTQSSGGKPNVSDEEIIAQAKATIAQSPGKRSGVLARLRVWGIPTEGL